MAELSATTDAWLEALAARLPEMEDPLKSNCCQVCRDYGPINDTACYAWCCATQDLALEAVFGRRLLHTALVITAATHAQNGRRDLTWLEADAEIQVGDLPCYDFKGHGNSEDMHIGGVVNPGTQDRFETIEGNWGDRCVQQWRDRTFVFGFIRPPFEDIGLARPAASRRDHVNYFMQEQAPGSSHRKPAGHGNVFKMNGDLKIDREYTNDHDRDLDMFLCNIAGTRAPVPADAQQIIVPEGAIHLVEQGFRARHS